MSGLIADQHPVLADPLVGLIGLVRGEVFLVTLLKFAYKCYRVASTYSLLKKKAIACIRALEHLAYINQNLVDNESVYAKQTMYTYRTLDVRKKFVSACTYSVTVTFLETQHFPSITANRRLSTQPDIHVLVGPQNLAPTTCTPPSLSSAKMAA